MLRLTASFAALVLAVLLFTVPAGAQTVPDWAAPASPPPAPAPMDESTPGLPPDPPQVPIDGGLGLLALAGAGYAARKLKQRQA